MFWNFLQRVGNCKKQIFYLCFNHLNVRLTAQMTQDKPNNFPYFIKPETQNSNIPKPSIFTDFNERNQIDPMGKKLRPNYLLFLINYPFLLDTVFSCIYLQICKFCRYLKNKKTFHLILIFWGKYGTILLISKRKLTVKLNSWLGSNFRFLSTICINLIWIV
jgi:hypothetical protein